MRNARIIIVMDIQPTVEDNVTLVKWTGVTDANNAGRVHGGVVMKLCDEAAGLVAIRRAHKPCVTASVDRMTFFHPVYVGEVLTLRAKVNTSWHTSMEVGVYVEAENPFTGEKRHTNSAYFTMVALDEHGQPTPVPPVEPRSDLERRREKDAQARRENRLAERTRRQDQ